MIHPSSLVELLLYCLIGVCWLLSKVAVLYLSMWVYSNYLNGTIFDTGNTKYNFYDKNELLVVILMNLDYAIGGPQGPQSGDDVKGVK